MNASEKTMTPELLRKKLFSKNSVHDLNRFDFSQVKFGVEVEYLIESLDDYKPKWMNRENFTSFLTGMKSFGFSKVSGISDQYRIGKDFKNGFVAIKPDFVFHILEIAFLPMNSFEDFAVIYTELLQNIDCVLLDLGYKRSHKTFAFPLKESEFEFVDLDRLKGSSDLIKKFNEDYYKNNIFCTPNFPASIVSTHIHMNFNHESYIEFLPLMYEMETLVNDNFTMCATQIDGQSIKNLRTLLYHYTLGESYSLTTVPKKIPRSLEDLTALYNESPKYYVNDTFFPSRDLCFIRFSGHGTIEFRSACTLFDLDSIFKLIAFRYAQILYSIRYKNHLIEDSSWIHDHLLALAKNEPPIHFEKKVKVVERFKKIIEEDKFLKKVGLNELFKS